MYVPFSLRIPVLGLAFSSVAIAQSPVPPPPTRPAVRAGVADAPPPSPQQPTLVTQSSRVRAFNPGSDGVVRSLYLQNGSVVDLTPALGGQLGSAVRKGEKITVIGTKLETNGQSLVEAASVQVNNQTFSANTPSAIPPGSIALADGAAPPPPGAPQSPPPAPAPRRRNKALAPAPCDVSG